MSTILTEFTEEDGTLIYVETESEEAPLSNGYRNSSGQGEIKENIQKAVTSFQETLSPMKPVIHNVYEQLSSLDVKPDEIEVQLNFKMKTKCGVVLANIGAEAVIGVKLKWSNLKDK